MSASLLGKPLDKSMQARAVPGSGSGSGTGTGSGSGLGSGSKSGLALAFDAQV